MLFLYFFLVSSAILGIDVGAEKLRVGYINPGKPLMVLSDDLNNRYFREILTIVPKTGNTIKLINETNFRNYDYYFNSESKALKYPNKTIRFFSTFLAKIPSKEYFKSLFARNIYPTLSVIGNYRLTYNGILPEVLLYHALDRINHTLLAHDPQIEEEVTYFAVPKFMISQERNSIQSISHMLNYTSHIIDQSQALSFAFAYSHHNKISKSTLPLRVAFLDIGETNTQITITEFAGKKEIISKEIYYDYNNQLGGRDIDVIIYNMLMKIYPSKEITDSDKEKIMQESTKIKHRLTTNEEAIGFIETTPPFGYNISRIEFNSELYPILEKIKKMIIKCPRVDIVHMIGGSSRVPSIQNIARNAFKVNKLSFSLNSEEAICTGATYYGATMSSSYKTTFSLNHSSIDLYDKIKFVNSSGKQVDNINNVGQYMYVLSDAQIFPHGSSRIMAEGLISEKSEFVKNSDGLYRLKNSTKKDPHKWKEYFINQQQSIYKYVFETEEISKMVDELETLISTSKIAMKDKETMKEICTEREYNNMETVINTTEKWMMKQKKYEYDVLKVRLNMFRDAISSVMCRYENKNSLETVIDNAYKSFDKIKLFIKENWSSSSRKRRPSRKDIRLLLAIISDTEIWLEERKRLQTKLSLYENPTLKWYVVAMKVNVIVNEFNSIKNSLYHVLDIKEPSFEKDLVLNNVKVSK
ncbi:hypothetical protein TVAG_359460 [Trichomonas vaginalis G3]|uniref:DnaK protein n=1 Tax=Trichomonas vaginalis (strain ATCC PRA-98 / G3) TaxID=412133 RepID=A2DT65_TRIV3|nr:ATP binding [Trichomonas vaginalis G3]EAY16337.1 hypothetical protein TVAG_359460 [Trichomonas vaginalis G3]KAI5488437.1 ATP binding [Trichomonas vaginalis G3]|eukprot:XP_001328560.1 hypothetical protein [Trichomonas vaginalis G3]